MSNQTPSIGRIVHYRIQGYNQPLPAVITQVDEEDHANVSLFIMSPFVGGYTASNVRHGEGDFEWNWPPFVPPVNKPDPKPVPTKFDVALILNKHVDATPLDVHRTVEEIMELFEDFLK